MYSSRNHPTTSRTRSALTRKSSDVIILRSNAYSLESSFSDYLPLYRYSFDVDHDVRSSINEQDEELEEGEIQEPEQPPVLSHKKSILFQEFIKQKSSQIFRTTNGQIVPYALKQDDMIIYTKDKLAIDDIQTINYNWISDEGLKLNTSLKFIEIMCLKNNNPATRIQYVKALNAIIRHKAACDLLNFGQTFFRQKDTSQSGDKVHLNSMLDCAFGIYLSGVLLTRRGPAVILDHAAAALTRADNFVNLLEDFRRDTDTRRNEHKKSRVSEPLQYLKSSDTVIKDFFRKIIGLKIYIRHMKHRQVFRFKSYTLLSSDSTKFFWDDEKLHVTISEYFLRKHSIRLKYPNLPCVIKTSHDKQAMYPFELCYLLEDQRIKKSQLDPISARRLDQTKESPLASICPSKRSEYSSLVNMIFNNISRQYLQEFSLVLSTKPITARGRIIEPPTLQYKNNTMIVPQEGRWKAQKFIISTTINHWFVINACSMTKVSQIKSFIDGFRNYSFIYFGLSMSAPCFKDISTTNIDAKVIHTVLADCSKECGHATGPQLIIFIVPEKNDLYSYIHYISDVLFGIKVTCIQNKNIKPLSRPDEVKVRFSTPIMTTLSQKINAKLGGINMKNLPPHNSDIIRNEELIDAMFVGCDVTHPDSGSSSSSIAACVASCGSDHFQYNTSIRIQDNKNDEIVHSIDDMLKELLTFYKDKNGTLPSKIFFYRDGVSEDQFDQVKQLEINKMDILMNNLYSAEVRASPSLTFIIVQKRHRMRFFEESISHCRSDVTLKNPSPGTVVDNTITSLIEDDFYLYSHWNQKGTSRPSHYHVIRNDSHYRMDKLQAITYYMCHTYARCSQSISIPAVVKYAHLAAYRARVLLASANKIKSRSDNSQAEGSFSIDIQDNPNDMIKLHSLLRNTMYFC